jgi:hypothetical protein
MASSVVVEERSVLVLGLSGAGISTLSNKLLGIGTDFEKKSGFKVAAQFTPVTTKVLSKKENLKYHTESDSNFKSEASLREFSVIVHDSPGVFSDKKYSNQVMTALKNDFKFRDANIIFFVARMGRFSSNDKELFDLMLSYFKEEVSALSALVITGCEGVDEKRRKEIVEEFKTSPLTRHIGKFMKKGIFTVGFPFSRCDSEITSVSMYSQSETCDIEKLRHLIFSSLHKQTAEQIFTKFWFS